MSGGMQGVYKLISQFSYIYMLLTAAGQNQYAAEEKHPMMHNV